MFAQDTFTTTFQVPNLIDRIKAAFTRKDTGRLLTLDEITAEKSIDTITYTGTKLVNISDIRGTTSSSRSNDFTADFELKGKHSKARWDGVAKAWNQLAKLPPVSLVQVGSTYFVQDGHHRVSVAHAYDQATIEAEVTVVTLMA